MADPDGGAARQKALDALAGLAFDPPRLSPGRRLTLAAIAVACMALGLAWAALIPALLLALVQHLLINEYWRATTPGQIAYYAIAAAALLLVAALVKSLVARPAPLATGTDTPLKPTEEGFLYAFLDRLAARVGAPAPGEVRVRHFVPPPDAHLALVRRGRVPVVAGRSGGGSVNGLIVTLPLPLVQCLTLAELAGLVAHELAHFRDDPDRTYTDPLHWLDGWLARAGRGPDAWDAHLADWRRARDPRWLVAHSLRPFIAVARASLRALHGIARLLTAPPLRRSEIAADHFYHRTAGSDRFAPTLMRACVLAEVSRQTARSLTDWRGRQQVGEQLPRFLVARARALAPPAESGVQRRALAAADGLLRARIAAADQAGIAAGLPTDLPAAALFADFPALAGRLSDRLLDRDTQKRLVSEQPPADPDLAARVDLTADERAALARALDGLLGEHRMPALGAPPLTAPSPADAARKALAGLEDDLRAVRAAAASAHKNLQKMSALAMQVESALGLIDRGFAIAADYTELKPADGTRLTRADRSLLVHTRTRARNIIEQSAATLTTAERLLARRLRTTLALLSEPAVAGALDDAGDRRATAEALLACTDRLHQALPAAVALFAARNDLVTLRVRAQAGTGASATKEAAPMRAALKEGIARLEQAAGSIAYPFADEPYATVGDYLNSATGPEPPPVVRLAVLPPEEEEWLAAARTTQYRYYRLYARALARLAQHASEVRAVLG